MEISQKLQVFRYDSMKTVHEMEILIELVFMLYAKINLCIYVPLNNYTIIFITACPTLGITPKNLQPKFPVSSYSRSLCVNIDEFDRFIIIQLSKFSHTTV